mgnify:CR=1 FL=1
MEQNTQSTPTPGRNRSTVESICFLRGDWIYLKNLSDGTETRLTKGAGPELSPTGEHLVFHAVKDEDSITDRLIPPPGRLRILNVRTKAISEFEQFRNVRVGAATWSNDGSRLAIWTASKDRKTPSIVIFNLSARNVEKEITTEGMPLDGGLFLDAWTPSDVSILFHTLGGLYEVDIADGTIQKLPVDDLFKSGQITSATRFSFSSDRRYLLFDKMIDSPDEPAMQVISLLELSTKTIRRVSPTGVRGRAPVWLPSDQEILFSRVEWLNEKWTASICRIALDGNGLTTLARDADSVSYSTR